MFIIGAFIGCVVTLSFMWQDQKPIISIEERINEIQDMSAGDVVDEFIPDIRSKLDRISEETTSDIVRTIIGGLRPYFEEISQTAYISGYREGRQAISGNLSATN